MTRVGILLMNLGGPERIKDVGPFLYNLFSDPEIIRLPIPIFQKPLAWWISTLRNNKSRTQMQVSKNENRLSLYLLAMVIF